MTSHVFTIEDDRFMYDAVDLILTQAGFKFSGARTGEEGLELLQRCMPDLILLDINLPKMSGLKVLQTLRQRGVTAPILMLTANGAPDVVQDVMQMGGTGYVLKPFEPRDLVERIKAALAPRAPRRDIRAVRRL